jgi:hypothetical protein
MPDWKAIVRENLSQLDLGVAQQEVVAELAGHVEDLYLQFRERGLSESEAVSLTLDATPNWQELARNIARAKNKEDGMNRRTKTLWLPGLVAFATASISLMVLERFAYTRPRLWVKDGGMLAIYFSWWLLLPFCGAAAAYLSRRAGGQRMACAAASLFPAIIMLGVFCFVLPVSILIERNRFVMQHPLYFLLAMANWTLVPGLALLLGAVPFLRRVGIQQT